MNHMDFVTAPGISSVEAAEHGFFLSFPKDTLRKGKVEGIELPGMARHLALERDCPWFLRPIFGEDKFRASNDSQYLLWQTHAGSYGLMLPLISGDLRACLRLGDGTLNLECEGALPGEEPDEAALLYVATGDDPFALSENGVADLAAKLKTFRLRRDKRVPDWVDHLGWCTWDSFYHDVDEAKVLAGMEAFKQAGFVPKLFILDDGWQDTVKPPETLKSFGSNPEKFPQGLGGVVERLKRDYGVKTFGVWHAFEGYWWGTNPEAFGDQYRIVTTENSNPYFAASGAAKRHIVHPDDAYRFYQDYYRRLASEGVDMVKTDNQSSFDDFTRGVFGRVSAMRRFQHALQGAAQTHLEGNLLNCMSMGSDAVYNLKSSVVTRNSADYLPKKPETQQAHVQANAMNNLWTAWICVPDWDMFQSGNASGEFHAAARALSGGPVYVSDKPADANIDILKRLCCSDGSALRCDAPALPTRDRLFVDCYTQPQLLKIVNQNGPIGVEGLFHCYYNDGKDIEIEDSFSPADNESLPGELFAVHLFKSGETFLTDRSRPHTVRLPRLGYEIATISPVTNGLAAFGLLDKFNGSKAVERFEEIDDKLFLVRLRDGGPAGFHAPRRPRKITVNGKAADFEFNRDSGLLTVALNGSGRFDLLLHL